MTRKGTDGESFVEQRLRLRVMSQVSFGRGDGFQSNRKILISGSLRLTMHLHRLCEGHQALFHTAISNEIDAVGSPDHRRVKSFAGTSGANRQVHRLFQQIEPFLHARCLDQKIA